jgi:hypothetical protein
VVLQYAAQNIERFSDNTFGNIFFFGLAGASDEKERRRRLLQFSCIFQARKE